MRLQYEFNFLKFHNVSLKNKSVMYAFDISQFPLTY